MGKSGTQGKGKPGLKEKQVGFGACLIKRHQQLRSGETKLKEMTNMKSLLDESALDDYLLVAEMEGLAPEVKRTHMNDATLVEPTSHNALQNISGENFDYCHLKIPRKPSWTREMSAEHVDRRETDAFLQWRREIAQMELLNPAMRVTPFEKNIEVWRQLWRVLERSDMAVQVVDARNPMLYYTADLVKYASEQTPPRPVILLINKADLLSEYQRKAWAKHFASIGVQFAFYSAHDEQEKIDALPSSSAPLSVPTLSDVDEKDAIMLLVSDLAERILPGTKEAAVTEEIDTSASVPSEFVWGGDTTSGTGNSGGGVAMGTSRASSSSGTGGVGVGGGGGMKALEAAEKLDRMASVLTRHELILLLTALPSRLGLQPQARHSGRICVGMLGYPNVGKSSAINTILGVSKSSHGVARVAVSSTPGKTKHFQTLNVSEALMLCDCPGLVFPSFMSNAGEMLCAGILPINQMRDYIEPAEVISSRVPIHLLEASYGMKIIRNLDVKDNPDRPPSSHEMLCAYCAVRGYITNGTGRWDEFRACKELLRDFNDGRLLFVAMPVSDKSSMSATSSTIITTEENISTERGSVLARRWLAETEKVMVRREKVAERIATQRLKELELGGGELREEDEDEDEDEDGDINAMDGPGGSSSLLSKGQPEQGSAGGTQMVFGGSKSNSADGGFQFYGDSDSDSDEDGSSAVDHPVAGSVASGVGMMDPSGRDHKRLKRWGKKNKKLRNKTPYGEDSGTVSLNAFTTNRSMVEGNMNNGSNRISSAALASAGHMPAGHGKLSLAGLASDPSKQFSRPVFPFQQPKPI